MPVANRSLLVPCKTALPSSRKPGIYIILNTYNGKVYIGQSDVLKRRCEDHYRALKRGGHDNKYLQSAWDKYGENTFRIYMLEECELDQLNEREQYYIDRYESARRDKGYNLTPTAGSTRGYKKNRQKQLGKIIGPEIRLKLSEAGKGRVVTAETRNKISATQKGKVLTEEHKAKIKANHWSKRSDAAEIAAKVAEGNRGKVVSDEQRTKQSVNHRSKNGPQSSEERAKRAQSMMGNNNFAKGLARKAAELATAILAAVLLPSPTQPHNES